MTFVKVPISIPFLDRFPYLLIREEKYGPTHYLIQSKEDLVNALRDTYNNRVTDWDMYDDDAKEKLKRIFAVAQKKVEEGRLAAEDVELAALASFLNERSSYEYEYIQTMCLESPTNTDVVLP